MARRGELRGPYGVPQDRVGIYLPRAQVSTLVSYGQVVLGFVGGPFTERYAPMRYHAEHLESPRITFGKKHKVLTRSNQRDAVEAVDPVCNWRTAAMEPSTAQPQTSLRNLGANRWLLRTYHNTAI